MANWSMNIEGGFAWIFKGEDPETKDEVTVGLVRKTKAGHKPHDMVLEVENDTIDENETTLPGSVDKTTTEFVLRGTVRIMPDGKEEPKGKIRRTLTANGSGGDDDFFHVFSLKRFDSTAPDPVADWPKKLMSSFLLRNGELQVREAEFGEFAIKEDEGNGPEVKRRVLSSAIHYDPEVSVQKFLKIGTDDGDVVLKRGSGPLRIRVFAACNCGNETVEPGKPLPGFGIIFGLYREDLDPRFRLVPCAGEDLARQQENPEAKRLFDQFSPGPDCPPSDHEAPSI